MKFIVREGFVIHVTQIVDIGGKPTEQTNSYYEGQEVNFDAEVAQAHLHKLEPADKQAQAFVAQRYAAVSPLPVGGIDSAALSTLIAQAVASAVAAVQTPAPQAAGAESQA